MNQFKYKSWNVESLYRAHFASSRFEITKMKHLGIVHNNPKSSVFFPKSPRWFIWSAQNRYLRLRALYRRKKKIENIGSKSCWYWDTSWALTQSKQTKSYNKTQRNDWTKIFTFHQLKHFLFTGCTKHVISLPPLATIRDPTSPPPRASLITWSISLRVSDVYNHIKRTKGICRQKCQA